MKNQSSYYVDDAGQSLKDFSETEQNWYGNEAEIVKQFFAHNPNRKDGKLFTENKLEDQLLRNLSEKYSDLKIWI